MSRSYKKHPFYTDGRNGQKIAKRIANHKVRKAENLPSKQRNAYKRVSESWEIHDYISRWTLEEAIEEWNLEAARIEEGYYEGTSKKWKLAHTWHAKYHNDVDAFIYAVWHKYYRRK